MAAERKPASNRGRATIDWNEARLFYCGLPVQERTYETVAAQFGVSARTVERHGTRERWREHARAVDQDAASIIARRIGKKRADEAERLMKLIEACHFSFAEQLRRGDIRMAVSDLERLHRLSGELTRQLDDTPPHPATSAPAVAEPSIAHKLQVIHALNESGALAALAEHLNPTIGEEPVA